MKKPLLCLALLVLATGAVAQENPAKLALAREVIALMKADQMFDNLAAQMKQSVNQLMKLPATATMDQVAQAEARRAKIMDLTMEATKGMIAKADHIYAEVYSEEELNAMKAFFSSPNGQSMIAKQPQIMARLMPMVQEMQRDLMPKIKVVVDEAKAAMAAQAPAAAPAPAATPASAPFSVPAPK